MNFNQTQHIYNVLQFEVNNILLQKNLGSSGLLFQDIRILMREYNHNTENFFINNIWTVILNSYTRIKQLNPDLLYIFFYK